MIDKDSIPESTALIPETIEEIQLLLEQFHIELDGSLGQMYNTSFSPYSNNNSNVKKFEDLRRRLFLKYYAIDIEFLMNQVYQRTDGLRGDIV